MKETAFQSRLDCACASGSRAAAGSGRPFLSAILVAFCAFCLSGCESAERAAPAASRTTLWHESGISMLPALYPGALIVSGRTPYSMLKPGDVCIYMNFRGILTVHRIVGGWPGRWIMKGDNNRTTDAGLMTEDRYISKCFGPGLPNRPGATS